MSICYNNILVPNIVNYHSNKLLLYSAKQLHSACRAYRSRSSQWVLNCLCKGFKIVIKKSDTFCLIFISAFCNCSWKQQNLAGDKSELNVAGSVQGGLWSAEQVYTWKIPQNVSWVQALLTNSNDRLKDVINLEVKKVRQPSVTAAKLKDTCHIHKSSLCLKFCIWISWIMEVYIYIKCFISSV